TTRPSHSTYWTGKGRSSASSSRRASIWAGWGSSIPWLLRMRSAGSPGASGSGSHTMIVAAKAEATAGPSRPITLLNNPPGTLPFPGIRGRARRGLPRHEYVVRAGHIVAEAVVDHGATRADRSHDRIGDFRDQDLLNA